MVRDPNQLLEEKAHRFASPTLMIGLGGTGAEVLSRVRDRIFSSLGPLENYPVIRYLWLDTDTVQSAHVSSWYKRQRQISQQLKFQQNEKVELTVQDTEKYLSHLDEYRHIRRWIYPHLSGKTSINEGAGQIRAYGRLALFHNVDQVRSRLDAALRNLTAIDSTRIALENGLNTNPDQLNVIIVGSIAGGTGSGTFLDTAYLVRQTVKQLAGNRKTTLMGFMVMPSVFGGAGNMSRLYANGYAALKELNHFNYSPPVERTNGVTDPERNTEHDYTMWWSANEPATSTAVSPFDVCYLVDSMNEGGASASGAPQNETVFTMISEAIFQDFSISEFGTAKRSSRDNLLQWLQDDARPLVTTDDPDLKLPKRYFSFGLATITFPVERVRRACSANLAMDIVDFWLRKSDDEINAADYVGKYFLNAINMVETDGGPGREQKREVLDALYASSDGRQVRHDVTDRVNDAVFRVKDRGTDRSDTSWGNLLREEVAKIDRDWNGERMEDPKLWGAYVMRMRGNQEIYLRQLKEKLDAQVVKLINNEHRGIGFALAVLDAFENRLTQETDGYVDIWNNEAKLAQDRMNAARAEVEAHLTDLTEYWQMANWHLLRTTTLVKTLDKFQAVANDLYQFRVQYYPRVLAVEIAREVRRWVSKDEQSGWRFRLARLQENLEQVREHLDERVAAYAEATPDPRQILLYDGAGDLKRIYKNYVPNATLAAKEYNDAAQQALGVELMEVSNFTLDLNAVCDRMMRVTEPHFATLDDDFDAYSEFHRRFPPNSAAWSEKIEQMLRACQPWVTWEKGYTGVRDQMDDEKARFILGVYINDDEKRRQFAATVLDRFGGKGQKQRVNLTNRNQIVFYCEVAGYALCQTSALATMRTQYIKSLADGHHNLHTDREDARFADLVVLNREEKQSRENATRAFLLGCIVGVIRPTEWKDGRGNREIAYQYLEKQPGLPPEPRELGNRNAVVTYLLSKRDSLLPKIVDDITWRWAELKADPVSRAEYAAVLRQWIISHYPARRIDMGNGVTEPYVSTERKVLLQEMNSVMHGAPPDFEQMVEERFRQLGPNDGFTFENLEKRRVLAAAAVADGAGQDTWRIS